MRKLYNIKIIKNIQKETISTINSSIYTKYDFTHYEHYDKYGE